MSTSSTSSSTASTTGFQLTSLGSSSALQITGLASGLDTDSIIDKLMALKQVPLTNLQNEESGLTAADKQLTSLQTSLATVSADAQALLDPSLFDTTQAVSSSNSTLVSASNSTGAGIGGYQVSVSQLANSAQRTYSYAAPTSADTMTIDGQAVTVAAGESISSLVSSINANRQPRRLRRGDRLRDAGALPAARRATPAPASSRSPTAAAPSPNRRPGPSRVRTRSSPSTARPAARAPIR